MTPKEAHHAERRARELRSRTLRVFFTLFKRKLRKIIPDV